MKKVVIKTKKNTNSVSEYLSGIESPKRREECRWVMKVMKEAVGVKPVMWGNDIVGFGDTIYTRSNGAVGEWFKIGFSSRKNALTLYLLAYGLAKNPLLKKLGKHKLGVGCL
ncbi:MAG: DUF1801 domain-containing protein [Candidatus Paceibacterota bacterium]